MFLKLQKKKNHEFMNYNKCVFQQMVVILMRTNCGPLLADLFLHAYESALVADLIRNKEHRLARQSGLSFRNTDHVLPSNNPSFLGFDTSYLSQRT